MINIESRLNHLELETKISTDVVIVGSGVLGLLLAKKLGDLGQSVILLESAPTLAKGASIKNHGWLHRGSAHAVSLADSEKAGEVIKKIIYGHEYIKSYAPEVIEDPFEPIFIVTGNPDTAEKATNAWKKYGVWYEQIPNDLFYREDPNLRKDLPLNIFQSADLRINNRMLFQKLAEDIETKGNLIINNSDFEYDDFSKIKVSSDKRKIEITSGNFIYCTGGNIAENYKKLTGDELEVALWKSHLIYLPRFSRFSLVSLDHDSPIIINHGDVSVINRAYDEVPVDEYDTEIIFDQIDQAFESVCYFYPSARRLKNNLEGIACIKPSIKNIQPGRHSVDSQVREPIPNHHFVLPGKMTEAPYVVDELIQRLYSKLDFHQISKRPFDGYQSRQSQIQNIQIATA